MANPHINYATFKSRFGDLGITEWTKYNYLSNYNFGLPAQTEVPSEYLELEWIKGDGASRIDTGIYIAPRMQIITDIIPDLNHMAENGIFGAEWIVSGWLLTFFRSKLRMHNGKSYVDSDTITAADGTLHIHTYDYAEYGKILEINGVNYLPPTDTGTVEEVTQPITLFNAYVPNQSVHWVSSRYGYHKLIKHEVYVDGELVQSLKPVKRLSDGAIGMYDTVTNSFFSNEGTGTFTAGPMKQRYVRVEYVEFNGDDYIDTGLVSTVPHNWIQDADVQFTATTGEENLANGANYGLFWGIRNGKWFQSTNDADTTPATAADINRHHFISQIDSGIQYNYLYVDGIKLRSSRASQYQTDKIAIGAIIGQDSASWYAKEKVYSYKIYEDSVLLRDFVPVYDLVTEKYGLFDLVSGTFYGSVNGLLTGPWDFVLTDSLTWSQTEDYRGLTKLWNNQGTLRGEPVYINGFTCIDQEQIWASIKDLSMIAYAGANDGQLVLQIVPADTEIPLSEVLAAVAGKYIQFHQN